MMAAMSNQGSDLASAIDVEAHCRFPSLCKLIEEPEAHPDLAAAIAPFAQQYKNKTGIHTALGKHQDNQLPSLSMLFPMCQPDRQMLLANRDQVRMYESPATTPKQKRHSLPNQMMKKSTPKKRQSRRDSNITVSPPRAAKLFAVSEYKIKSSQFNTSGDPRGYIPVYSYYIGSNSIIIDTETSFVSLSNICNALGRPDLLSKITTSKEFVQYLYKVIGTQSTTEYIWAPISIAREICRRICWNIRFDLVPIFGYHFPTQCLAPNDPHFEDLSLQTTTRRANSRLPETSFAKSSSVQLTAGPVPQRPSTGLPSLRSRSSSRQSLQTRHRSETVSTNTSTSSAISMHSTPPTSTSVSPLSSSKLYPPIVSSSFHVQGQQHLQLPVGKTTCPSVDPLQSSMSPFSLPLQTYP